MSAQLWRVGRQYGIHVYEGDRPVATFHTVADAALAVKAHNEYVKAHNEYVKARYDGDWVIEGLTDDEAQAFHDALTPTSEDGQR
jgi:hypothetical protein